MERASRIVSILLGLGVTVLLWPVAVPLGFGEVWWASQKAQWQSDAKPLPPAAPAQPVAPSPAPPPQAAAPLPTPAPVPAPNATCGGTRRRLARAGSTAAGRRQDWANCRRDCEGLRQDRRRCPANHDRSSTTASPCATAARCNRAMSSSSLPASPPAMTRPPAKGRNGKAWPCGAAAKAALTRLIHARAVTCEVPKQSAAKDVIARCSVAETDLSTWMVQQGWAEPKDTNEPALVQAAAAAKQDKLGLWRGAE